MLPFTTHLASLPFPRCEVIEARRFRAPQAAAHERLLWPNLYVRHGAGKLPFDVFKLVVPTGPKPLRASGSEVKVHLLRARSVAFRQQVHRRDRDVP